MSSPLDRHRSDSFGSTFRGVQHVVPHSFLPHSLGFWFYRCCSSGSDCICSQITQIRDCRHEAEYSAHESAHRRPKNAVWQLHVDTQSADRSALSGEWRTSTSMAAWAI